MQRHLCGLGRGPSPLAPGGKAHQQLARLHADIRESVRLGRNVRDQCHPLPKLHQHFAP